MSLGTVPCWIFLFLCMLITPLDAFHAPSIPIKDVQADTIEFQNKKILLRGRVMVSYDMGTIRCDEALVSLGEKSKGSDSVLAERIDLDGHVEIDFTDGSSLTANKGEIFCQKREAVFYASPTEKVVYTSFCNEDDVKIPVIASGKKIAARIVKDESGKSSLSDIRGEGSVTIEYLRPTTTAKDEK